MADPRVVGPGDGQLVSLGSTDARFLIDGRDARNCFALVEHPLRPHALAAPMHRQDEYSFVLEGTMGALLGNAVVTANPGDLVFKPRNQWHTFSNAGDQPARILEIISPAGFENYFRELGAELLDGPPNPHRLTELCSRYELDVDLNSIPGLIERFGVRFATL